MLKQEDVATYSTCPRTGPAERAEVNGEWSPVFDTFELGLHTAGLH